MKSILLSDPGKNGFLLNNSANKHPTDQTSTLNYYNNMIPVDEYSFQDNNNSGALYHLVAT